MRLAAAALAFLLALTVAGHAATIFAEVTINGNPTGLVIHFEQQGDDLTAAAGDLESAGLLVPQGYAPKERVSLRSLPGVSFVFHAESQVVAIIASDAALRRKLIGGLDELPMPDKAAYGALINYGVAGTFATQSKPEVAGNLEFRAFGPIGVLETNWYGGPTSGGHTDVFRRLDTAFIHDEPEALRTWTAGDFIAASLPWSRSFRGAGFSVATDFSIRPDLITEPMPWLAASASVPSTADLFVNGVRQLSAPVAAGPFAISQAPMVNGSGDISLVVSDALGRQTVQNFSFYASNKLLADGLYAYALEAGWLRENFGVPGDRYTDPFAQGLVRWGATDWLTLELRAGGTKNAVEMGAGFEMKIAEFAVLNASIDDSSLGIRDGRQLRVGIERQTRDYSIFLGYTQSFGEFRDIASAAGDTPVRRSLQAGIGWNSETFGTLGVNYFAQELEPDLSRLGSTNTDLLTASWTRPIFEGWTIYATAYHAFDGSHTSGFMVGLRVSPGEGLTVDGGVSGTDRQIGAFADAFQSTPTEGGWGWTLHGQSGPPSGQATVRYVSPIGEVGAGVITDGSEVSGSAYVTGSVVWLAGGRPHLARQTGDGFADVDTGMPGVGITLENRPIGTTGDDGRLLVTDLVPYVPNRLAVVPNTVPLSADIVTATTEVRPPRNAGVVVRLQVRPSRSRLVRFVLPDGTAPLAGVPVRVNDKEQGITGYDGVAWLTDLAADNRIEIGEPPHGCVAQLHMDDAQFVPGREVGPIPCLPQ
jgi:outer membrane usher protein